MKAFKLLSTGVFVAGLTACALAQIDGPTPLAWRWSPPDVKYAPDGSPLVDSGKTYVAAGNRIFALDATSGNELWKFPLDGAKGVFRLQPIVTNKTIIDVTDSGFFYAANQADGVLKWIYQLQRVVPIGQPVGVGNLVVFKQSDNTLNALSLETGQPVWEKPLPIDSGINGPLLVHGDDILFADNNNHIVSLNAVTQKVNWQRQFGYLPPDLSPALYGDNMYLYSGQYLVCLNVIKGFGKWQINLGQNMEYGPAVSANGLMCVTQDGNLFFFDLNGRRTLREVVNLGSGPAAEPGSVGNKYLVPTNNGALNLIDPKTGQVLWSYTVRPIGEVAKNKDMKPYFNGKDYIDPRVLTVAAAGPPTMNGDTMLILGSDASLLAFDKKLGVDLTPPDVDMLFPRPGAQMCGLPPLDIIFKISDETTGVNMKTLKIDVDGTPLEYLVGGDGVAFVHLSVSGKNKGLLDGRRIFTVSVSDWIGNEIKKPFALMIDNSLPPLGAPKGVGAGGDKGKGAGSAGKGGGGGGAGGSIG